MGNLADKTVRNGYMWLVAGIVAVMSLLVGSPALAADSTPIVDGIVDDGYQFVGEVDPGSLNTSADAPGNLFMAEGNGICYYAFVVDRGFNDNVYGDKHVDSADESYLALDGWNQHTLKALIDSDHANFAFSEASSSAGGFVSLDYLYDDNGQWRSGPDGNDVENLPSGMQELTVTEVASSLLYNLNTVTWPEKIRNSDIENGRSPDYDYNDSHSPAYQWHMVYEFSVAKSEFQRIGLPNACADISAAGAHNSPYKQGAGGGTLYLGDEVWQDLDGDGVRATDTNNLPTESGFADVTVKLYADIPNDNGSCDPSGASPVRITQTDPAGFYVFEKLNAGNYCVEVMDSTLPSGSWRLTTPPAPRFVSLIADDYTVDFGYQPLGAIGDFVWWDRNSDGRQEVDEQGIPSVTVHLYDSSDTLVASTESDVDGFYSFNDLVPDTYRVAIDSGEFSSGGTLAGWSATDQNAAGVPADEDSDGNPTGHDASVSLDPGETDLTIDFGFVITSSFELTKRLTSFNDVRVGDPISFTIQITNTGSTVLTTLPLTDTYDTAYLTYLNANSVSDDNQNDGTINWTDLTATEGDLAPGGSVTVVAYFSAMEDTSDLPNGETINTAVVSGVVPDPDGASGPLAADDPLAEQQDDAPVRIQAPTAVTLASSSLEAGNDRVILAWETVNETDMVGFNLWRTLDGEAPQKLNQGLIEARRAGQAVGALYGYVDGNVVAGRRYYYWLESVRSDGGTSAWPLGSVSVRWYLFLPATVK